MRQPLRVGMIGTGWMGDAIAPDFARCDGIELVAIAGRDSSKTGTFARRHRVPRPLTAEQLIDDNGIDLVYVATTHGTHFELADAALRAGKSVLVEKAFTVDAHQAGLLVDRARASGLFLMEAMWMRFNPVIDRVTSLLADGCIGDVRTVTASFGSPVPRSPVSRLWDPRTGGGSLLDQGVYPLALADLVFGIEPDRVQVVSSNLDHNDEPSDVDTELALMLGYPSGKTATATTSIRTALPLRGSMGGSAGWIDLYPAFWCPTSFALHRPQAEPITERFELEGNGYVPMLRAVTAAIVHGQREHELSSLDATLRVMRTVDRVRSLSS